MRFLTLTIACWITACGAAPVATVEGTASDDIPDAVRGAFYLLPNCGAVKIHADRPLYLSALHCFQDDDVVQSTRAETVQLGDLVNYDWIVRYAPELEGVGFAGGRRVVASGREWTGFALDVLKAETDGNVAAARRALTRDWVVFEDPGAPNASTHACLGTDGAPAAGESVTAFGRGPRTDAIDAERGTAVDAAFMDQPRYAFADEWTSPMRGAIGDALAHAEFIVSDAFVHPGMSGGPVVDGDGRLVGLTTVKLVPNFCTLPPEQCDGSLFATHGAVALAGIFAARPDVADLFVCDL